MVQAQIMKSTPSFGTATWFSSPPIESPILPRLYRLPQGERSFQPSVENGYFQLPRSFCNIIIVFTYVSIILKGSWRIPLPQHSSVVHIFFDPWFNPLPGGSKPPHRWRVSWPSQTTRARAQSHDLHLKVLDESAAILEKHLLFAKPPACCLFCSATSN